MNHSNQLDPLFSHSAYQTHPLKPQNQNPQRTRTMTKGHVPWRRLHLVRAVQPTKKRGAACNYLCIARLSCAVARCTVAPPPTGFTPLVCLAFGRFQACFPSSPEPRPVQYSPWAAPRVSSKSSQLIAVHRLSTRVARSGRGALRRPTRHLWCCRSILCFSPYFRPL